jgi:predicted unusual protein kinase regulating ubiquinone biosynthesis (AarF/ABC1/UbiB family)
LQKSNSTVEITLLDVGMVIKLNESKKKAFRAFLHEVLKGDPQECARMIYNLSLKGGKQLQDISTFYEGYLKDLEAMFSIVSKTDIADLEGIDVLHGMLRVIRKHKMKIDGEISILFTNMLILEAIAKDLDP